MNYSSYFQTKVPDKGDILKTKQNLRTHRKDIWTVLHTTSVFLPEQPNEEEILDFTNFVKGILYFGTKVDEKWHDSTMKYIEKNPPSFDTRENSMLYLCHFHNNINIQLEKDLFECTKENLHKRWGNYSAFLNSINNNNISL